MKTIDIKRTANEIIKTLKSCNFNDVTDSSGYFIIKEFPDGSNRAVDVSKAKKENGNPYLIIFCSYENDESDWKYTDTLSVNELINVLQEVCNS